MSEKHNKHGYVYKVNECPHCGENDDWSDIVWDDPYEYELTASVRCPHCGGLHVLKFELMDNVPCEG